MYILIFERQAITGWRGRVALLLPHLQGGSIVPKHASEGTRGKGERKDLEKGVGFFRILLNVIYNSPPPLCVMWCTREKIAAVQERKLIKKSPGQE